MNDKNDKNEKNGATNANTIYPNTTNANPADTKNKVSVVIGGEIITLVSGEQEEYMQKLARYIDKKIDEIRSLNSNATINERTRTLFIAVNVADDYFKAIERLRKLEEEHDQYIVEMGRMQEENLMMAEKLRELQTQLVQDKQSHTDNPNIVNMSQRKINGR